MRDHKGFTLIELIIVVVVLSIVSVVAFAKFVDLSKDATIAKLEAKAAALEAGYRLINAKVIIDGNTTGASSLNVGSANISIDAGYPSAHWNNSIRFLLNLDSVSFSNFTDKCQQDWCGKGNQTSTPSGISLTAPARVAKAYPRGYSYNDECGVYYVNRTDGSEPEVGIETADC